MEKLGWILFFCFLALSFTACGGISDTVQITTVASKIYTDTEIQAAIDEIVNYFNKEFKGCTLTEISYIGDENLEDYAEFAERYGAEEVIVLVSSFDVGASGGDGSLEPDETYRGWLWILVRENDGGWKHVDHGY